MRPRGIWRPRGMEMRECASYEWCLGWAAKADLPRVPCELCCSPEEKVDPGKFFYAPGDGNGL